MFLFSKKQLTCFTTLQASLLGAMGRMDTETAKSLRRSASSSSPTPASSSSSLQSDSRDSQLGPDQPSTSLLVTRAPTHLSGTDRIEDAAGQSRQPSGNSDAQPQASTSCSFSNARHDMQQSTSSSASSMPERNQLGSCSQRRSSMHIPFSAKAHALASDLPSSSSLGSAGFGAHTSHTHVSHATSSNRGTLASCSAISSCSHVRRGSKAFPGSPATRSWRLHAVQRGAVAESDATSSSTDASATSDAATPSSGAPSSDRQDRYALLAEQLAVTGSISDSDDDMFPGMASTSTTATDNVTSKATIPVGNGSSSLSSTALNESTISLDLADLPTPPVQLPKPQRSVDVAASSDDDALAQSKYKPRQRPTASHRSSVQKAMPKSVVEKSGDSLPSGSATRPGRKPLGRHATVRQSGDASQSGMAENGWWQGCGGKGGNGMWTCPWTFQGDNKLCGKNDSAQLGVKLSLFLL